MTNSHTPDPINTPPLDPRSRHLRTMIVRTLEAGGRGHIGSSMSLVEILRVLYDDVLHFDPANPRWEGRDRCILSKGHGCIALYVLLADKGFFPTEQLWQFCKTDGILGGHPEAGKVPGVEASTGSLGHGLAIGLGMAIHAKCAGMKHRVFVILGDGECNEGSVWEAAMIAGKHKLDNLTVLIDYNKHQSAGSTKEILDLEPFPAKWNSFGFSVREVDGHDVNALRSTLADLPFSSARPNALICHTIKGKGISFAENNLEWHHKTRLPEETFTQIYAELEKPDA